VQRAVIRALDFQGLYDLGPSLHPWYGFVPDYILGGMTADQVVPRDLDEARRLMAEAGYADGFEVELCTTSSTAFQPSPLDYAQKVQSDLAELGISVQITALDNTAFLTRYRAAECGMVLSLDGPALNDPSHLLDYVPNSSRGTRMGWVDGNLGENGQRILDLVEEATLETDEDARGALWNEITVDIAHNGPFVAISSLSFEFLARSDIEGLDTWANSHSLFNAAQLSRSTND
jgi:peptide/nickel transport system substrate-binding protein